MKPWADGWKIPRTPTETKWDRRAVMLLGLGGPDSDEDQEPQSGLFSIPQVTATLQPEGDEMTIFGKIVRRGRINPAVDFLNSFLFWLSVVGIILTRKRSWLHVGRTTEDPCSKPVTTIRPHKDHSYVGSLICRDSRPERSQPPCKGRCGQIG